MVSVLATSGAQKYKDHLLFPVLVSMEHWSMLVANSDLQNYIFYVFHRSESKH